MLKLLINRLLLTLLLSALHVSIIKAQSIDPVLVAQQYVNQGEIEKAKNEYAKLSKQRESIPRIHETYFKLLLTNQDFKQAEKYMKGVLREYPSQANFAVDQAVLYRAMNELEKQEDYLENLIDEVTTKAANENKVNQVRYLASVLFNKSFSEEALQTYEQARSKIGRSDMFALDLANIYRVMNRKQKMIQEYLYFSKEQPRNISYVKNSLQRYLTEPQELDTLEISLYQFIQTEAGNPVFNELLVWTHLQQKNFPAALRQARALDKRLANNGDNILQVGLISYNNRNYKTAQKAFDLILKDFQETPSKRMAEKYALLSEEEVIKSTYPIDTSAIFTLIDKYASYMENSRDVYSIAEAKRRVALLQAFQLNRINDSIETLKELLEQPLGKHRVVAEAKMDLADIYLLDKQPWESILLYGQVERLFKDQPLGYQAKLKAAKLSYFKGEFELATSNLDILKLATSREIANDALDLSILIKNNTVFDSTDVVMQDYASIELMIFQNQVDSALISMDRMLDTYQSHSIVDELLFLKAKTLRQLGRFDQALAALEVINKSHYYELLGDDALFLKAKILDEDKKETDPAMKIYQNILVKFPGSIFVSESRNRFRELRGDFNN